MNKRTNSGHGRSRSANSSSKARRATKLSGAPRTPLLEPLEPRTLLSTYFVTTAADAGDNSLRAAIIQANQNPGHDVIDFEINGGSAHIQLTSALPTITDELTLDGATQTGYAGSPLVWLDGRQLAQTANGLTVESNNSFIRGLAITGFDQAAGIELTGAGNMVQGCFLGLQPDGQAPWVNNFYGLFLSGNGNMIGGPDADQRNVLSGNSDSGVLAQGQNNQIIGNYIGLDPTGTAAMGNAQDGVNVVGLSASAPASATILGNFISANQRDGVGFYSNFADSFVGFNLIGMDATGHAMGNWGDGVYLGQNSSPVPNVTVIGNMISANWGDGVRLDGAAGIVVSANLIGTDISGTSDADDLGQPMANNSDGVGIQGGASGNTIGGPNPGDGNIISNNWGYGVSVTDNGTGNVIQGNFIGTDNTGCNALPNSSAGLAIISSGNSALGNVISGNYGSGITIQGDANIVQGNLVGIARDKTTPLSNWFDGITIDGSGNLVGGVAREDANAIAYNVGNGITVTGGAGNAIRGNFIFGNASGDPSAPGIGIDLGYDGVTPNDSAGHNGPNMFQNYPVLVSSSRNGDIVTVQGTLTAGAMQSFTIEFFSNAALDPSANLQGQTFIGSATVTTDATGVASFNLAFDNVIECQDLLTATVTDAQGNTSEFSGAILILTASSAPAATATNLTSAANPSVLGQTVTLTASVANLSGADVPTGLVNFMEGQTIIGSAQIDPSGQASFTTSDLSVGSHTITAVYAGEGSFITSTSNPLTQMVDQASTATSVASSANPVTYGQSIALIAGVSPVTPGAGTLTGAVTFMDGATTLGTVSLSNGQAVLASVILTAGTHNITAIYEGDANFRGSTSTALNQAVTPAVLTVTALGATKTYGDANPALTSTIAGFVNGDTAAAVTGSASVTTTATASSSVGSYAITATQGTLSAANYTFNCVSNSLTVTPAVLTVTANAASKTYGAANPALTSTFSGFVNGDTASAVTGAASLTTSATAATPVGTYAITAAKGTLVAANYTFACVGNTLTVTPSATASVISSSTNPSVVGQAVTFAASVNFVLPGSGSLTGLVTFKDGTTVLGTATLANGTASFSTSALAAGNHTITAIYGGDSNCTTSTSAPVTQAVSTASSLAGYVYLDANNDGVKQTSETGIAGVWITLRGTNDLGAISPISVQTTSCGFYSFANLRPGTYAITETTPTGYLDGTDTIGTQGGTAGSDVLNIVLTSGVTGANNNFGELKNAIAGHTFRDMSGNGMTSDDTPLSGVTVKLYQDRNGNGTLDSTDGAAVASTVSNASGAYAFLNFTSGQYIVNATVPSGYTRTIPYFSNYYAANLKTTPGATNFDFDNYKQCTGTVTNVTFKINGCKTVTDLRGATKQGDTVTVTFTVTGTTATHVTLVTYNAPSATFDATVASQQSIDQQVGGTYNPGIYSLTVTIPNNYYQIDFIKCVAIDILGPANSNIFYSAQNRLISADNAGTHSDVDDMAATAGFWANLGQTLIRNFNVTDAVDAPTALGDWLASNYANLYGARSASNMAGKTNDEVAALFMQLYGNSTRKTDAAVLAAALNVYATTSALGGDAATTYGFAVTDAGLGAALFNVGSYGSAFGVANNSTLTVSALLAATNAKSNTGVLYNGLTSLLTQAFSMYTAIDAAGGIA